MLRRAMAPLQQPTPWYISLSTVVRAWLAAKVYVLTLYPPLSGRVMRLSAAATGRPDGDDIVIALR